MLKICPHTGLEFSPKRYNQIYCNRSAQIQHNNVRARKNREFMNPINKILESNRKIFLKIIGNAKEVVKSYDFLQGTGFNFNHFTQSYLLDGKPVQAIYEFIIYQNENKTYTIKKIKE